MAEVLSDPALYEFTGGSPPTIEELRARYERWLHGSGRAGEAWHNWVVRARADGAAVGHIQATVREPPGAAEMAWVIGTERQGRGLASEASRAVVDWLDASGVGTIDAHIKPGHRASEGVAERIGLAPTAELVDGERVWRRTSKR
jgi:RimJ/RimL family protein N-acetyltransferase